MTPVRRLLLIAALVTAGACSSGDDDAGDATTATSDVTAATEPVDASPPATSAPSSPTTERDETTESTAPDEPDATTSSTAPPAPLIAGVDATVTLLTPASGAGIRPLLEWSPVADAARYLVVVYAPDERPYWTWSTTETSVHVSGEPVLDDERPGPAVSDGMTWGVVALDDATVPIAYSARQPIAP
ncbi:MAG: hypothetical protein HKN41_04125 [Ilumatobacter sp.]|nr:hypothetical protein [Ilumatobacter sp.]